MTLSRAGVFVGIVCMIPFGVNASSPEQSLRPSLRVETTLKSTEINKAANTETLAPTNSVRPTRRILGEKSNAVPATQVVNKRNLFDRLKRKKPAKRQGKLFSKPIKKGSACGVPGIEGARIKRVPGRIPGCGVAEPVRITSVGGVVLSQPAVMDCPTAKALYSWINNSVVPAVGRKGGGVRSLKVAAHYACRTRNNRKGARISEHGKGRAIDISAINLNDGSSLTVLKDWRSRNSKIMREIHKGACGPFGTVLGPQSDRYHQDHFHFDTARYRSGPYCR